MIWWKKNCEGKSLIFYNFDLILFFREINLLDAYIYDYENNFLFKDIRILFLWNHLNWIHELKIGSKLQLQLKSISRNVGFFQLCWWNKFQKIMYISKSINHTAAINFSSELLASMNWREKWQSWIIAKAYSFVSLSLVMLHLCLWFCLCLCLWHQQKCNFSFCFSCLCLCHCLCLCKQKHNFLLELG